MSNQWETAHVLDSIAERFPDNRRCGATTLRQCQLVMTRMLKILDFICGRHNINYWMTAGTLIGAIRHKGFIPWDCDIDVGISRLDLARLKRVIEEFPFDIFYQDSETDPYYPKQASVVKLRDRYSNYVEWQQKNPHAKWHNGLQVDLFVYQTDEHGLLINPFKGTRYRQDEIFPCTRLEFEGVPLCAPKTYDEYLRRRYGNYLKLPDPMHRIAHEGVADPFTPCDHSESLPYGSD